MNKKEVLMTRLAQREQEIQVVRQWATDFNLACETLFDGLKKFVEGTPATASFIHEGNSVNVYDYSLPLRGLQIRHSVAYLSFLKTPQLGGDVPLKSSFFITTQGTRAPQILKGISRIVFDPQRKVWILPQSVVATGDGPKYVGPELGSEEFEEMVLEVLAPPPS